MRRAVSILGTLLIIVTILISGSVVAGTWLYIDHVEFENYCTNPNDAVGIDDGDHATIGQDDPVLKLGSICLDLGDGNAMGPNQIFWVNASSDDSEEYKVWVTDNPEDWDDYIYVGYNEDTAKHSFTTPYIIGSSWRWVYLEGKTGLDTGDYAYGPDIDAVGWESP